MEHYSITKGSEMLFHATTCENLKNIMLSKRIQVQYHTLYDSIDMKCSEKENLEKKKNDQSLPGTGVEKKIANKYEEYFGGITCSKTEI